MGCISIYRSEEVLKGKKQYDVVIDRSDKMHFTEAKHIMKYSFAYIYNPGPKQIISSFFINLFSRKKNKPLMLKPSTEYLAELTGYAKRGMAIMVSEIFGKKEKRYEIISI